MLFFDFIDSAKIEDRPFQLSDAEQIIEKLKIGKNCGLVYPTGLGKSFTAYMVMDYFLAQGKILVNAHSNPLVDQHYCYILDIFKLEKNKVEKLIGKVLPKKRRELWQNSQVAVATPQTIVSELNKGTIDFTGVALVIFDEMQMAKDKYAYVEIARRCRELKIPILGLTASTGGSKIISKDQTRLDIMEKIYRIDWWIYRSTKDADIQKYLFAKKEIAEVIQYPEQHMEAMRCLRRKIINVHNELADSGLNERLINTADLNRRFPFCQISDLKKLRFELKKMANELKRQKQLKKSYRINVLFDAYMKLMYLLNLFVTEGYQVASDYIDELVLDLIPDERFWQSAHATLKYKNSVAYEILKRDDNIRAFYRLLNSFIKKNILHPKLKRLVELVKGHLKRDVLILIFGNYKKSIDCLHIALKNSGIGSEIIAGVKFMDIEKQREILERFKNRGFSVLLSTPVIEAGIHVPKIDVVFNYSMPLTGVAQIQRRGRAGRTNIGLIYYLIMDNSNDTSLYYAARSDNASMDRELRQRILIQAKEEKGENTFFLKAKQSVLPFNCLDETLIRRKTKIQRAKIIMPTEQLDLFKK